ncbi:MAG: Vacuolar protein sorting-associated protein 62 [Baekduia sp.]|nr:Vacuolar protein sorting-associated protein 62 [Baekduia sp.]
MSGRRRARRVVLSLVVLCGAVGAWASVALAATDAQLALQFRPLVRFDNSEDWRPLNLDGFLAERDPATGAAYHQLCDGAACAPISAIGGLALHRTTTSHLDVHGSGGEANYHSPDPACNGTVRPRRDCGSGPTSATYVHVVPPLSPAGYKYFDYWMFYRYDYVGSVPIANSFNHEGDWENVTVGVRPGAPTTFDYVTFSQHGGHFAYLRQNLQCDAGGSASCGTTAAKRGTRVWDFVANGTHANYATRCSELFFGYCRQSDGITPDRGHDGAKPWAANGDATILQTMPEPTHTWPTGSGTWSDWPGTWGVSDGPASPGNQNPHFTTPWVGSSCFDSGCALPARAGGTADGCGAWLGGDVAALSCSEPALSRSLATGALDGTSVTLRRLGHGPATAARSRRSVAAQAAPLAQLVGAPLQPGERLAISSVRTLRTTLSARVTTRGYSGIVRFDGLALRRGARATLRVRERAGRPMARLVTDGRVRSPSAQRVEALPQRR